MFIAALVWLMFSNGVRVRGPRTVEVEPGLQVLHQVLLDFKERLVFASHVHLQQDVNSHIILYLQSFCKRRRSPSHFFSAAAATLSFLTLSSATTFRIARSLGPESSRVLHQSSVMEHTQGLV